MQDLAQVAATGDPDQVRAWIRGQNQGVVEGAFLNLQEKTMALTDSDPGSCRRILNAVMPVLTDNRLNLFPVFVAFLLVAARLETKGGELFEAAIDLAKAQHLLALAAKGTLEWAHVRLREGNALEADALFAKAQHLFLEAQRSPEAEKLWIDRADAWVRCGRWQDAIRRLNAYVGQTTSSEVRGRLQLKLAQCYLWAGDPVGADEALRVAEESFKAQGDSLGRHVAQTYRAHWFWQLGAHAKAHEMLEEAKVWFLDQNHPVEALIASANLAALSIARDGDLTAAEQTLERLRAHPLSRDSLFYWQITMNLAAAEEKLGRYAEATSLYQELAKAGHMRHWERQLARLNYAHLRIADAQGAEIEKDLNETLEDPLVRGDAFLRFVACENMGDWHRKNRRCPQAQAHYRQGIECLEHIRLQLPWEFLRRQFRQARLRVYDRLQAVLIEQKKWRAAWQTADEAKAQSLADFLGGRYPALTPESYARFLDVRGQLSRAYALPTPPSGSAGKQGEIDRIECLLEQTLGEGNRQYAGTSAGEFFECWPADQDESVALIEYVRGSWGWSAFVVRGARVNFHPLSSVGEGDSAENKVLAWWRKYQKVESALSLERWNEETSRWYQLWLEPLSKAIEGAQRVIVVPYGKLCLLPWAGLWDAKSNVFWSDQIPKGIVVLPGARIGRMLMRKKKEQAGEIDLVVSPSDELPFANVEAQWVEEHLGSSSQWLRGEEVTEDAFRRVLPKCRWLHFCGHGHFDKDRPMASFLQLARAERWTGWDMLASPLPSTTVVLASCEVGSSHAESGEEWFGLLRGFLMANAGAVLASLWETSDLASLPLIQSFYLHCRAHLGDLALALRLAQQEARSLGEWAKATLAKRHEYLEVMPWQRLARPIDIALGHCYPNEQSVDGLALVDIGMKLWMVTPAGRHANETQIRNKMLGLLGELSRLAHPRHWALFQLYGEALSSRPDRSQ